MRGFLRWWFETTPEGMIEVAWNNDQNDAVNKARHFEVSQIDQLVEFAVDVNSRDGHNCYFTPVTLSKTDDGRAKDEHFIKAPGFWLDQDEHEHVLYADTVQHPFFPTSAVYTGLYPHPRRQMYFRLDAPVSSPEVLKDGLRRLLALYKGDKTAVNPSRLMRLPGTIAWPKKKGRILEMTSWAHPTDGRSEKHTLALALSSLPPPDDVTSAAVEGAETRTRAGTDTMNGLIAAIQAGENWHTNLVQLTGIWVARGYSDAEILLSAPSFTLDGFTVDQTIAEMQTMIDGGRRKWNYADQDQPAINKFEQVVSMFGPADGFDPATTPVQPLGTEKLSLLSTLELYDGHGHRPEFLVEGVLPRGSTCMISGLPGTAKSPMCQDLAACVALGMPWAGNAVQRGRVLYVAGESHSQTAQNLPQFALNRFEAEYDAKNTSKREIAGILDAQILTLVSGFIIDSDTDRLMAAVDTEINGGRWDGAEGPDLIVLDTLRAITAGSVNEDNAMIPVQTQIDRLKRRWPRAVVILIHQSPKGDPESSSGTNRLEGLAEVMMNICHIKNGVDFEEASAEKKPHRSRPDINGWTYTSLRVSMIRNKSWNPIAPFRMMLSVKDDSVRLLYGDEAEDAVERLPIADDDADERIVPITPAILDVAETAATVDLFVLGLLRLCPQLTGAQLVSIATRQTSATVFKGATPRQADEKIRRVTTDLHSQGAIKRIGRGKGSGWALKGA